MTASIDLRQYEIHVRNVVRNAPPAVLYEDAVSHEQAAIASSGA